MDNIIAGLVAAVVVALVVIVWKLFQKRAIQKGMPYEVVSAVLSPLERNFLMTLMAAVSDQALVMAKVRVVDVIKPRSKLKPPVWRFNFDRIVQKEFDFVVCHPEDSSVLAVVDINTASNSNEERQKRNEFLSAACSAAEVPLLFVDARASTGIEEIRALLEPYLPVENGVQSATVESATAEVVAEPPFVASHDDSSAESALEYAESEPQQAAVEVENTSDAHVATAAVEPKGDDTDAEATPRTEPTASEPGAAGDVSAPTPVHETAAVVAEPTQPVSASADDTATPPAEKNTGKPSVKRLPCPRCGSDLGKRKPTSGKYAGQWLWICSDYPQCKFAAPIKTKSA